MEDSEIASATADIVRSALKRPDLALPLQTTAADVPGWDSFAMITILMEIESRFGVSFTAQDLDDLRNFGDLSRSVADKLRVRDA